MIDVIPAIMPQSYDDLVEKAQRVRGFVSLAQVDIMDGIFVRSKSWPYTEGGTKSEPHFISLCKQEEGMPFWDDLDYEIDLMIAEPEKHIDEWLPLGASRLIFHIESIKDTERFFAHDIFKEGARDIGGEKVIAIGIAINPDTPLSSVAPYLSRVDFVQMMGIANIGYQGQEFDERTLERVNQLRVAHQNLIISVDGGVNRKTAKILSAAGANRLVAGSAIFDSDNIAQAIKDLKKI